MSTYVVAICDSDFKNQCFVAHTNTIPDAIIDAVLQYGMAEDVWQEEKCFHHYEEGIAAFDKDRLKEFGYLINEFMQWGLYVSFPLMIS